MKDNKVLVLAIALIGAALGLVLYLWFVSNQPELSTTVIKVGSTGFQVNIKDAMTVTAGQKLSVPISLSGMGAGKGKGIEGLAIKLSAVPPYLKNPTISLNSALAENWEVKKTDLSSGKVVLTARDNNSKHALTSNLEKAIVLGFDVESGVAAGKISMEIEIADNNLPSKAYYLKHALTLKVPQVKNTYTISGNISGDVKEGVTLTCGSLPAVISDSAGYYIFSNVPNGTTCALVAVKDKYFFTPSAASIKINSANVTQNFVASLIQGATGPQGPQGVPGPQGAAGEDGDDGDDGDDGKTKVVYYSTGSTGTTSSGSSTPQYAPQSGMAENIIIAVAAILGLVGAMTFIGAKLKWFS